ncbi:MAG: hypothetical protein ACI4AM_06890 [Muribaculaceae bacterium]
MTFEKMEQLKGQLITLDCALAKYARYSDIKQLDYLMNRLALDFDNDDTVESDCNKFLNIHSDLIKKFQSEAS